MKGISPQAIESEIYVLGALMINKHTYIEVESIFNPDDFYKPEHQVIATAIKELKESYDPVEIISVAEKLNEMGKIEFIGGAYYLTQITDKVASSANIGYHIRIVKEKAFRRNLIAKSMQTIKDAYDESIDIFDLLENTEKSIANINSAKAEANIKTLEDVNTSLLNDIESTRNNPNEIIGVPYGFEPLDNRFGGKKDGNLIILAARPAMGKSGLMNNAAKNAAELGKKIAIFSLEMPAKELATRLLSSELEINSRRIQEAKLNQYEYVNLQDKVEYLNKLGIFIIDKPALSITQIKGLARTIKTKHGLDEIWIDYLQLMKGSGKRGNREQEISEISRGLKELAKELELPIIALSQLSRAVEVRGGDKRPMLSDLRECLPVDEWVSTPEGVVQLKDKPDQIITSSSSTQYISNCEFIEKKYNTVYQVKSQYGTFRATANHLVLTGSGWKKVKNLVPKRDVLASPKIIPHANKGCQPHARFLGWMIGNGSFSGTPSLIYRRELDDEVKMEVEKFGVKVNYRKTQKSDNVYDVYMSNGVESGSLPNPVMSWIRYLGLENCNAYNKYIPNQYLGSSDYTHIQLLKGLWESDGTVTKGCAKYATVSELLARQVAWLLLTIGVRSTVNVYNNLWEVRCSKADNKNMEKIVTNHIRFNRLKTPSYRYIDPSPSIFVEMISELTNDLKIRLQKKSDGSFKSIPKRTVKEIICEHPISTIEESPYMTMNDMGWGRLYSVEKLEKEVRVCDLHVPVTHNFISNGIVVHNSGAIEQDADIVMFLYRPEYYGIMEDENGDSTIGITEVITSKFRGGSIGTDKLKFIPQFVKFEELSIF